MKNGERRWRRGREENGVEWRKKMNVCIYSGHTHIHIRVGGENDRVYVSRENGRMYASM